jgi:DeoR/GlpR family transcriptional regulator of sugar metabolism
MRYEKTLSIQSRHVRLLKLVRKGKFSSPDLAQELGVSEQTIYRDIDFLRKQGHAIRAEKHSNGWAYHLLREATAGSSEKRADRK